jgi:ubiquinone biosynthesis protein
MRSSFTRRAFEIVTVLGGAALRFGLFLLGQELLRVPGTERDEAAIQARGAVLLRGALERLGATFIKLGQVMSTRPDLFPWPVIAELRKLQDRLPGFAGARALIEAELGPAAAALVELDEAPIAAASVAQVHRGRLATGEEVAVKVLRPEVRAQAEGDGEILLWLAGILERVSGRASHAQLRDHLQHFLDGILEQTDLRIEARNYARFRHNFRKRRKVRFPVVHEALCAERVLTMSFVRGRKIDTLARGEFPELPRILREAFLQMCFDDGLLHADLHPGNFLVQDDGGITIFDVGLAKSLSDELLEHYIDFNRCLALGTVDDFMRHLRRFHSYVEGTVDWAELERDMRAFHAEFLGRSAKDIEFGKIIDRVFSVGRKHGVRPVPDMTLMMVGLVTAEGIGKALDPDVNSFQEVANYLLPVLARRNLLTPELIEAASQAYARTQAGPA